MRGRLIAIFCLCLAGCEDNGIRVYAVPHRDRDAPPAAAANPHAHAPGTPHPTAPAEQQLAWELPSGWRVDHEPRDMRWGTLIAGPDAPLEVAITRFPGDVGGDLKNVNRWRSQIGLGPVGEADLASVVRPLEGAALPVKLVDLAGPEGKQRLIAAIVPGDGVTWFVKAQGPGAAVETHAAAMLGLLRSLRFSGSAPPPPLPINAAPSDVGAPAPPPFGYQAPEGWTVAPATPPRLLSLVAGKGEVSVSRFPGDVFSEVATSSLGGLLANVNRWRGQVGLQPVDALPPDALRAVTVGAVAAQQLELVGPKKAQLVVLVPHQAETWFIKLSGDPATIEAERGRFDAFLGSIRWEKQ